MCDGKALNELEQAFELAETLSDGNFRIVLTVGFTLSGEKKEKFKKVLLQAGKTTGGEVGEEMIEIYLRVLNFELSGGQYFRQVPGGELEPYNFFFPKKPN
jgi:hypothetical protein